MYLVEVWNEDDFEEREKGAFVNSVDILLDSEKELNYLIKILLYSGNVFTVRKHEAILKRA